MAPQPPAYTDHSCWQRNDYPVRVRYPRAAGRHVATSRCAVVAAFVATPHPPDTRHPPPPTHPCLLPMHRAAAAAVLLGAGQLALVASAPTPPRLETAADLGQRLAGAREFFFAPPPTEVTVLDEPQLGAAAAAGPADLPELMGWAEWKAAFGRAYGPAEEARRAATFARTIEVIVAPARR